MNRVSLKNWFLIGSLSLIGISSCTQPGEALNDRKKRENDAEIAQYIAANNLTGRAQTTENGTSYIITTTNPAGQAANIGDEIKYHYISRRFDGLIVDSTDIAANLPQAFTRGVFLNITAGLYDGIVNAGAVKTGTERVGLRKGETATLLVPSYLDGGRVGSLLLPQYSPIRYDVTIVNVRTEVQQIDEFVAAKAYNVTTTTPEGIRIVRTLARPDSAQVKIGQTATIKYTGKLLGGFQFDANTSTGFSYKVGDGSVIKAWDIVLPTMRVGEKFFLITPSSQGYGQEGRRAANGSAYTIPPFSPMIFEMEVVSSK